MTQAAITGASGFIGKHLVEAIERRGGVHARCLKHTSTDDELLESLRDVSFVLHLAGVNRPDNECEFQTGNVEFTRKLCDRLRGMGQSPTFVLTSSVQALLDNPYGRSKRHAESEVERFVADTAATGVIFRLPNVFGKWCRPNYNSVIATLSHNIAHDLPITLSDPAREITFVYIDDVIDALLSTLNASSTPGECRYVDVAPTFKITLGALADRIRSFRDGRETLVLPDFADRFTRCLYATYLSHLDEQNFAYALAKKSDNRGDLAEFLKSDAFGQIFVSRTRPGAVRGNHYHHTKTEKFLVLEGDAVIRFRHLSGGAVIEYPVSGQDFRVVDIPPGYAHSIENVGRSELIVLFWASEIFDSERPDTVASEVPRN